MASTSSRSATARSTAGPTSRRSISKDPTSRRRSAPCRGRTKPGPSGEDAQNRWQRHPPRRALQRPRRRHPAGIRGSIDRVPRMCGGHLPRPLVPRPDLHPHPRLRKRFPGPRLSHQGKSGSMKGTGPTTKLHHQPLRARRTNAPPTRPRQTRLDRMCRRAGQRWNQVGWCPMPWLLVPVPQRNIPLVHGRFVCSV